MLTLAALFIFTLKISGKGCKIHKMRNFSKFQGEDLMEYLAYISKTDLARKTRQVIKAVQRGQTVIVESHGQPEAAILDMPDYYLLLAVTRSHAQSLEIDPEAGLQDEALQDTAPQERYDRVITHYLAGAISLGRAAELLNLPWGDLRARLSRLGLPILLGAENIDELQAELDAVAKWEKRQKPRS
jgi:prevent-host-death family protein